MKNTLFILPFLFLSTFLFAQVATSSELFQVLRSQDSLLFNIGFNTCNIEAFEKCLSDDFEFYHDEHGMTGSKVGFITNIKNGLCQMNYTAKRVLEEHALEVFPLKKNDVLYGAIQKGIHHFYAIEKNNTEYLTSIAKFTHVWLLENEQWKLIRSLSYDHQNFEHFLGKTGKELIDIETAKESN